MSHTMNPIMSHIMSHIMSQTYLKGSLTFVALMLTMLMLSGCDEPAPRPAVQLQSGAED